MPAPVETITDWRDPRIDEIIDVRSPAEFADDHIPGAINLPVFSNEERAHIGTIYKQQSPFLARREGAAIVSANIAHHIHHQLADKPENWRPLLHCWRGGQRSRAFAHICGEIGWASFLLSGGYKTYRNTILDDIARLPEQMTICIISGATGSGKTHLLHALKRAGAQILDLEALACHKGSLLGAIPDKAQPSQRYFESCLSDAIHRLDKERVVFVEAESSRVGNISLPKSLWHNMGNAMLVELHASLETRCTLLKQDYAHLMTPQSEAMTKLISGMVARHGHETTQNWQEALLKEDYDLLVTSLLDDHYDPAYQRASTRHNRQHLGTVSLQGPLASDFDQSAGEVLTLFQTNQR